LSFIIRNRKQTPEDNPAFNNKLQLISMPAIFKKELAQTTVAMGVITRKDKHTSTPHPKRPLRNRFKMDHSLGSHM
jgi:hypothetical protein